MLDDGHEDLFGGIWLIFTLIIIKLGNELTDGRHEDPDS